MYAVFNPPSVLSKDPQFPHISGIRLPTHIHKDLPDETQMRHRRDPGTPRGGAGRRGSEPRAAEARGEGEHIHAPTHNLTQSQKAGPNRIKNNTTADASVVASPVSQGRIRTEGKRPKGSKQGRLTVRGNDRHRNWSLDAVLTWRAQRGKPTRRVQLSSHA